MAVIEERSGVRELAIEGELSGYLTPAVLDLAVLNLDGLGDNIADGALFAGNGYYTGIYGGFSAQVLHNLSSRLEVLDCDEVLFVAHGILQRRPQSKSAIAASSRILVDRHGVYLGVDKRHIFYYKYGGVRETPIWGFDLVRNDDGSITHATQNGFSVRLVSHDDELHAQNSGKLPEDLFECNPDLEIAAIERLTGGMERLRLHVLQAIRQSDLTFRQLVARTTLEAGQVALQLRGKKPLTLEVANRLLIELDQGLKLST